MAQAFEKEWKETEKITQPVPERRWHPPKPDWKMFNVGFTFDNNKRIAGGGWVLRNERGVVLLYSRRSFAGIKTKDETRFEVLLWATKSMKSHRQTKTIMAGEFIELFGAVQRPEAWPSFLF